MFQTSPVQLQPKKNIVVKQIELSLKNAQMPPSLVPDYAMFLQVLMRFQAFILNQILQRGVTPVYRAQTFT